METIKIIGVLVATLIMFAGCGLGGPSGSEVNVKKICQESKQGDDTTNITITNTNDCDKSTRTAEPFVVEPKVVEVPAPTK